MVNLILKNSFLHSTLCCFFLVVISGSPFYETEIHLDEKSRHASHACRIFIQQRNESFHSEGMKLERKKTLNYLQSMSAP